ncbi:MAG: phenylacetate--CoA ligase family protein [bacterium]
MNRKLLGQVAISLYDRLSGRNVLAKKHVLTDDSNLSYDENRIIQTGKLVDVLKHAFRTVPFYRETLSHLKLTFCQENALETLQLFPIMSKNSLLENYENLHSSIKSYNVREVTTGGSTGRPTVVLKDSYHIDWMVGAELLFYDWAGYYPGMKLLKIWGSERDIFEGTLGTGNRVKNFLMNRDFINTFRLKNDQISEIFQALKRYKSEAYLVYGYVESMYLISKYFNDNKFEFPRPVAVLTTAGTLFPEMRHMIEQVFKCPVMNKYGCREINSIACECPNMNGLHIPLRLNYIEILNNDNEPCAPGEVGEIAITSLTNYSMPLIRYKLGDMAKVALHGCDCNINFPVIDHIIGRTSDVFETKDGEFVHGEFFSHIFYDFPWVNKFRVIQESHLEFTIELEFQNQITDDQKQNFETLIGGRIKKVFGQGSMITFKYESELKVPASGKFRFTISKVRKAA